MAMNVILRNKNGGDVLPAKDIGPLPAFPDIITYTGVSYILRRVTPDKQTAYYSEAIMLDLPVEGG